MLDSHTTVLQCASYSLPFTNHILTFWNLAQGCRRSLMRTTLHFIQSRLLSHLKSNYAHFLHSYRVCAVFSVSRLKRYESPHVYYNS
ncbi:hypothetical protein BABINDRAFT_134941 [Babjeviella inositovora NRRL Y-12698]|uniref:Uncharacterized protein n=1 Tax=Babjeviella inositovora NRRL Y-12698 TaxID=984486 RepID=A0A1E3QPU7_9ASCO|nr:uncharacterized protein BABINDRAFT_134941 [Babjeviella inositovora NRRL Y-12698]ODQ79723.1 hypothetical protein BABINDRAFT_134941 [Babjeviella inositovora NRRL Y-12698]